MKNNVLSFAECSVSCKCSNPAKEVNKIKVINANSNKNVTFSMWHFQASQPHTIALELDKYDQLPLQMEIKTCDVELKES